MAVLSEAPRAIAPQTRRPAASREHGLLIVALGLLVGLAAAIYAQWILITTPYPIDALLLFVLSGFVFLWALEQERRRNRRAEPTEAGSGAVVDGVVVQVPLVAPVEASLRRDVVLRLGIVAIFALAAWLTFGGNRFTLTNVAFWIGSIAFFVATFAKVPSGTVRRALRALTQRDGWTPHLSRTTLLVILIVLVAIFFRFWHLDQTPSEMVSDHPEKLLDVNDVLNGQLHVFFPRNTGREAFQFYLAALTVKVFDMPLGHMALKVGTAAFGVFAIPWIYLLGKELFTRNVGLIAATLAAISLWHTSISRFGLRYPLTAAFAAPALFFLVRAFKHNRRNDWLLAGLFVGIGLHTYVPFRAVPLLFVGLVLLKFGLDFARRRLPAKHLGSDVESTAATRGFWVNACLGGILAALVFLPLARYAAENPDMFWFRALTRSTGIERQVQGSALLTFIDNQKSALLGFNFRGDSTWVTHISYHPMLDAISAALFFLGMVYVLWRLVRYRDRACIYLLVMLFGLMLPSTTNIAFPFENPSGARAGGAIIPVAILAALPLALVAGRAHGALQLIPRLSRYRGPLVVGTLVMLLVFAARLNYNWYFFDYDAQYRAAMGNATEMGTLVKGFATSIGDLRHAYYLNYPYWIDGREIGIVAGDVTWSNFIDKEQVAGLARDTDTKLFLVNVKDDAALAVLGQTFPEGSARRYVSRVPNMDFMVFLVPPR